MSASSPLHRWRLLFARYCALQCHCLVPRVAASLYSTRHSKHHLSPDGGAGDGGGAPLLLVAASRVCVAETDDGVAVSVPVVGEAAASLPAALRIIWRTERTSGFSNALP